MKLPLAGIKVLSAARLLPGGYCAKLLSDLGAAVIKIEHPAGGDPMRLQADMFSAVSRGNRSVTINLRSDGGKEICYRIARQSDIFIEGFRPGVAARLGIDYQTLKGINSKIIYASISGFGQDGPYRNKPGHDPVYQGVSGMLSGQIPEINGSFNMPFIPIADLSSAMFAAISILSSLYNLKETGAGQYLDVSMTDGLVSWMSNHLVSKEPSLPMSQPSVRVFQAKDGKYLTLAIVGEEHFWRNLFRVINREDLAKLADEERSERDDEIFTILSDAFRTKNRDEWLQILDQADVPIGPVYRTPEEVLADPQLRHRGMVFNTEDPQEEKTTRIGSPFRFSDITPKTGGRVPRLGEHTEEILQDLGYDRGEIETMKQEGVV